MPSPTLLGLGTAMPADGGGDPGKRPAFDPETYASWFESDLGRLVWRDERAVLLPLLGPVQGRTVLDAGVGDARLALELARLTRRVRPWGVCFAPLKGASPGARRRWGRLSSQRRRSVPDASHVPNGEGI